MTARRALFAVLLVGLALVVRLAAHDRMAAAADTFAPVVDSEAYLLQALRVAAGEDIVEGVYFQAPLYPWLLGLTLRAAGVPGVVGAARSSELPPDLLAHALAVGRALNLVLGVLLVLLVARLGERLFSPGAGLAAGVLAALSSPFLFYEGHLLKVSLSLLPLPWAVLAVARAEARGRPGGYLWVGLALGLGGLVRGNMHLLAAGAALVLLVGGWRARRAFALRAVGALGLGVALALAPVVLRNSLVAGRPVLSTAAGGTAFYLCNHAGNDTGLVEHLATNRQIPRYEFDDWKQRAEADVGQPLTPAEISSYWMGRALDDIAADPGRWLLLELRKLFLLVSRYEAPDNTLVLLGEREIPLLARTPSRWSVVVPLACAGLALACWERRRGARDPGRLALALALGGYAASLLLFNMTARFRMPVAPLAMVYAGHALATVTRAVRERLGGLPPGTALDRPRRWLLLAAALGAGVVASRVSEGPLGPLDGGERATHLAVRYANRSRVALARGELERAEVDLEAALEAAREGGKTSAALLTQRAGLQRARSQGDPERLAAARADLTRALTLNPDFGPAWRLTGLLEYDAGRFEPARAAFERALLAVPLDREARQYLTLSLLALGRGEQALTHARQLRGARPEDDDGPALVALACLALEDRTGARAAVEAYDRLASLRESRGLPRRFPDQPAFAVLREP